MKLRLLSEGDCKAVYRAAIQILQEMGMMVKDLDTRRMLQKAGRMLDCVLLLIRIQLVDPGKRYICSQSLRYYAHRYLRDIEEILHERKRDW